MLKCKAHISLCMVDIFVIFISNYYYKNWNYCYIVTEELLFGKYLRETRFCSVLLFVHEFPCFINYLPMNVRVSSNTSIFWGSLQFPLSCLAWEIFDSNCIFLDNNLKNVFTQQYYYFTKILIKLTLQIGSFFFKF